MLETFCREISMRKKIKASKKIVLVRGIRRGTAKPLSFAEIKPAPGLCFRCEHRALYLQEKRHRPRLECGMAECAVRSCYMYLPVKPLVLEKSDKRDPRPMLAAPFIASRVCGVRIASCSAVARKVEDGIVVSWSRAR
jgi:hypothetical protein